MTFNPAFETQRAWVWAEEITPLVAEVFNIYDVTVVDSGRLKFRGRLLVDSEHAYAYLYRRLHRVPAVPLFRKEGEDHVIYVALGELPRAKQRVGLALVLFALTGLSVFWAGLWPSLGKPWPQALMDAFFFAVPLIVILAAHEMGHYIVGRFYGTEMSLPYFIPMPLFLFGTMGAFIRMVAPPRNRRQWLHIAAAGPLAGLVFALPLTFLGLLLSHVEPLPPHGGYIMEGNSLLYAWMKFVIFHKWLPSGGEDVFLHPMAWAGWAGLLVTALNLIPAAQLDGGHVARALLGPRGGRLLTYGMIVALLALTPLWTGWGIWALIIFLFSRYEVEPLDAITEPSGRDKVLAAIMLIIFVLLFTPIPLKTVG